MGLFDYLDEYKAKFGEQFPMMACLDMDEGEIIKEIKTCIVKNKVYEYDTRNKVY